MPVWLVEWFTHNFKRFAGVAAIAVVIIGLPTALYFLGYRSGYAKALKENPNVGVQNIQTQIVQSNKSDHKVIGMSFNIWKLKLDVGI